jgi:hypothetical protein
MASDAAKKAALDGYLLPAGFLSDDMKNAMENALTNAAMPNAVEVGVPP